MNKIYIGIESQKKREQIFKDIRSRMCLNDTYTEGCECASCKIALEYHPDFLEISSGKKEASDDAILFCQEGYLCLFIISAMVLKISSASFLFSPALMATAIKSSFVGSMLSLIDVV